MMNGCRTLTVDGEGDGCHCSTGDAQTITIDVKAMDKGQGFEIIYYSKIPDVVTNTAADLRKVLLSQG